MEYKIYKSNHTDISKNIVKFNKANWLLDESHKGSVDGDFITISSKSKQYVYPFKVVCSYNSSRKTIRYSWNNHPSASDAQICSKSIQERVGTKNNYSNDLDIYLDLQMKLEDLPGVLYVLRTVSIDDMSGLSIFTYLENVNKYEFKRINSICGMVDGGILVKLEE